VNGPYSTKGETASEDTFPCSKSLQNPQVGKGHSIAIYQIKVINTKLALRKNQILINRLQAFVTNQKQSNWMKSTLLKLSRLQVAQALSPEVNSTILFGPKQTNNERISKSKRLDTSTRHQLNCHYASQSRRHWPQMPA
jgi:hypothetical protein